MAFSSSSSPRPLDNISNETDSRPHELPACGWDVFLSHSGGQMGFVKDLFDMLCPPYKVFFGSEPLGEPSPSHVFDAAKMCKVALVVLSNEFFCFKWPMLELSAFFDAGVQVLPLFYELSPQDLSDEKKLQQWRKRWDELASKDGFMEVSVWERVFKRLGSINGLVFKKSDGEQVFLEEVVSTVYQLVPPLFRSSTTVVHGRDRLCKVFIDELEKLEQRPQNLSVDLSRVSVLGVYGLPGSGKSTVCACLHDHFFSSFAGRALHLKLPTDPTPTELLENAKQLLKITDFGHNKEKMVSEIEDLPKMFDILKASNLRRLRVFLVIDNISSQESVELVEAILQLGVGAGSRVMLVAHSREILCPLLNFPGSPLSHIHYVCCSMTIPSLNETEAISLLMESAGGLGVASSYSQKMEEKYSPSHRRILAKVARMCAFRNRAHGDLLYLPLALKIIGPLLRNFGVDLDRQFSKLDALIEDLKEVVASKIVTESYQKLPEKLKLLFLDVALFVVPYCQFRKEENESAIELLGFMHECKPHAIESELNALRRLGFLESGSEFGVHDVYLVFAKSVPDASSMYYCRRRNNAGLQEVMLDLSIMARKSPAVLRALILELDEKCERFEFPAGLSSVKVVVLRQCKSLEVLGLAGLMSLVSLEIEDCPRLKHVDLDPGHAYTLKSVSGVSHEKVYLTKNFRALTHSDGLEAAWRGGCVIRRKEGARQE